MCFEGKSVESRSSINIPIPYAEVAKTPRSYDPILSVSQLHRDAGSQSELGVRAASRSGVTVVRRGGGCEWSLAVFQVDIM